MVSNCFFPEKIRPFLVITLCKLMTFLAVFSSSLPFPRGLSSVLSKFSHKKYFSRCHPPWMMSPEAPPPPPLVTPLSSVCRKNTSSIVWVANNYRYAIADKPRCSVSKLWQKYECEKRASNMALSYGTKDISKCITVSACASVIANVQIT